MTEILCLAGLTLGLSACAFWDKDFSDYGTTPVLQLPEQVTRPQDSRQFVVPPMSAGQAVTDPGDAPPPYALLASGSGVVLLSDRDRQWVLLEGEIEQVLLIASRFWVSAGYAVERLETEAGLLQTAWLTNPRETERERFSLRAVPAGKAGALELRLDQESQSHESTNDSDEWRERSADVARGNEMLARLARYLGGEAPPAAVERTKLASRIVTAVEGHRELIVETGFDEVWLRLDSLLEGIGFTIQDRDRSGRLYSIYNRLPESALARARLTPEEELRKREPPSERYQVHVEPADGKVRITILDRNGRFDASALSRHLLLQIQAGL